MESYNKHIANNPKVEMIHLSLDEKEEDAAKWAKQAKLPWLTILESNYESVDLDKHTDGGVPDYILLSPDGKVLAKGKDECFKKITSL